MSEHRASDVAVSGASDAPAHDRAALAAAPRACRQFVAARHGWDKIGGARGAAADAGRPRATR